MRWLHLTNSIVLFSTTIALTPQIAQANPEQCPISGTWDYQSPHSLAYRDNDFRPTNSPYSTTLQLQETNIKQEKAAEGDRNYIQQTSNLGTTTQDSAVPSAQRITQNTRIGKKVSIDLKVPVTGTSFAGNLGLMGQIQRDCNTIQGKIYTPDNQPLTFTLRRQGSASSQAASQSASQSASAAPAGLSGDWVVFLGTPLDNYGHSDRITQTGNQFQLESGISGETFPGTITGDRVDLKLPRTGPGTLSPDGHVIRFADLALVRLGSPTCPSISACKLP